MQPEARISRKIIDSWRRRGAVCWKVWGNERTPAGLPDIVGVYKGRFVFCETKTASGRVSTIQMHWIKKLIAAGACGGVCRSVEQAERYLDTIDESELKP